MAQRSIIFQMLSSLVDNKKERNFICPFFDNDLQISVNYSHNPSANQVAIKQLQI